MTYKADKFACMVESLQMGRTAWRQASSSDDFDMFGRGLEGSKQV